MMQIVVPPQKNSQYDPEYFENEETFTFLEGNTTLKINLHEKQLLIETDKEFMKSLDELCWQKYGLKRNKEDISDKECQSIHEQAIQNGKKATLDKLELICQDLLKYQYLTYDITFFFLFMKILFINGVIMSIGYAIPAIILYGKGNRYLSKNLFDCQTNYCKYVDQHSMYNQENHDSTFTTLEWLGLGLIAIMQIIFFFAWKYNKQIREILKHEERCSERSLLIKGLPQGSFNEKDILQFIQRKWKNNRDHEISPSNQSPTIEKLYNEIELKYRDGKIKNNDQNNLSSEINMLKSEKLQPQNHFKIKSIQINYDFHQARQIVQKISQLSKEIWSLLQHSSESSLSIIPLGKEQQYLTKKQQIKNLFKQMNNWRTTFIQKPEQRKKYSLASVLLHFNSRQDRDVLLNFLKQHYQTQWIISWGYFQESQKIKSITGDIHNSIIDQYQLKVGLAPQPQNILWDKVEHTYDQWAQDHGKCRIAMVVVPLISVGLIIGLQILKIQVKNRLSQTLGSVISVALSIVAIVINNLSFFLLEKAVSGQQLRLATSYQIYINYAGFAGNSLSLILAPISINYLWNGNYFGSDGVAGTAFQYQLSTLVTLPMMILQPLEILKLVIVKIKFIRNFIIRYKHNAEQGQILNDIFEFYANPSFDVAVTYSFLMANFLHCTFFCMLVPTIIPIYTVQIFLFFWVCKIRLLKFCNYPQLVRRWLLGIVFSNLMVSPLFFAGGYLLSEHAYKMQIGNISHTPIGIYVLFAWVVIFSIIALKVDSWLNVKKIFQCVFPQDDFSGLQNLQISRNRVYPSKSTSYYIGNNMLNLFGFEKAIIGTKRDIKAQKMLQMFCEAEINAKKDLLNKNI